MNNSNTSLGRVVGVAALVAATVCLLGLWIGSKLLAPNNGMSSGSLGASQYAKIQSAGTIRAAYAVGAPLFTIDPNTKQKSGLFFDLVTAAAAKLNLKVGWTNEVGYGEMIAGLNAGKYDIVGSGVWMNAARGKDADFTIPVYYDAVLAYVRESDTRFDNDLSILNSPHFTISTMDGELGAAIAQEDFPKAKTVALPQNADFSQLIQNVINDKADVVFLAVAPARQYQMANPGKLRAIPTSRPVRLFPVTILLPKGSYELKQALDAALSEMQNSGETEQLLKKYEAVPGSFLRVASPINPEDQAK
jgi:ABC-type amino acid transport substrate-binding protein